MTKIPTTSSSVNIDGLHPRFQQRLEMFFADPRITNLARGHRVKVVSGTRTYAQQKYLYDGWKSGRLKNLAANPDRRLASGFQGSYHMSQPAFGGYGFAVDLRQIDKTLSTREINSIAAEYGIVAVIASKEWWHHQPCKVVNGKLEWFPTKHREPAYAQKTKQAEGGLAELISACRGSVLRLGDEGLFVTCLQNILADQGYSMTNNLKKRSGIDGKFGKMTDRAVRQFQKDEQLTVDGIVGRGTWDALLA
jgi:hypothetical protein